MEEKKTVVNSKKLILIAAAAICVAVFFVAAKYAADHIRYRGHATYAEREGAETGLAKCFRLQDRIFRYSGDGVSIMDQSLDTVWSQSLGFASPFHDVKDNYAVLYDKLGTELLLMDRKGTVAKIRTSLPIVKASVSAKGSLVVIVDEGSSSCLQYYGKDGGLIADISGGAVDKGDILDAGITDDGNTVAVSFVRADQDGILSTAAFYRFGSTEQMSGGQLVFEEEFAGQILPKVATGDRWAAFFTENGFISYNTGGTIARMAEQAFGDDILSAFGDGENLGFLFNGRGDGARYRMSVWTVRGKELCNKEVNFLYDRIAMEEGHIVLSNDMEMAVYTKKGLLRFEGVISDGGLRQVIFLSRNQYLVCGNMKTEILRLKLLDRDENG